MIYNNEKIISNIHTILDELGIKYKRYNNRLAFPCPIHGGDKSDGVSLFISGNKMQGNWSCWTNHCEEEYGKNIFGFVKAVLSIQTGKDYSFVETLNWFKNICGNDIILEQTIEEKEKSKDIYLINEINKIDEKELGVEKATIRQSLIFPAKYYLDRGFSKEILDRYDVGLCTTFGKQMYNRAVVPIYDDNHNLMIGCVGRSLLSECPQCKKYHLIDSNCPQSSYEDYLASKWINSKNFNAEKYLYNFWFAKDYISLYQTAILIEGQGDVWRLEEADIKIGLGLFGSSVKDSQILKLEKLPIINLIVATDSDAAGEKCKQQIYDRLNRSYNLHMVNLPKKDIGDMSIVETKTFFKPILEKHHVH